MAPCLSAGGPEEQTIPTWCTGRILGGGGLEPLEGQRRTACHQFQRGNDPGSSRKKTTTRRTLAPVTRCSKRCRAPNAERAQSLRLGSRDWRPTLHRGPVEPSQGHLSRGEKYLTMEVARRGSAGLSACASPRSVSTEAVLDETLVGYQSSRCVNSSRGSYVEHYRRLWGSALGTISLLGWCMGACAPGGIRPVWNSRDTRS